MYFLHFLICFSTKTETFSSKITNIAVMDGFFFFFYFLMAVYISQRANKTTHLDSVTGKDYKNSSLLLSCGGVKLSVCVCEREREREREREKEKERLRPLVGHLSTPRIEN
jgi:hypothetical protein